MSHPWFIQRSVTCKLLKPKLTSVSIQSSKGDPLLCWAGAVGDLHLQFIPRRLLQVVQDVALGQRCALGCGPGAWVHCSVLQYKGGDWTASVIPASQVEPGPRGVDAGEEFMFFGKLRFWREYRKKVTTFASKYQLTLKNKVSISDWNQSSLSIILDIGHHYLADIYVCPIHPHSHVWVHQARH